MIAVVIGGCGAIGALARFLIDTGIRRVWVGRFPVATLLINVTGSLILGGVLAAGTSDQLRLAVGVGFCGGYTTFSTAMYEALRLIREQHLGPAMLHLFGQPLLCVLAAAAAYAGVAAI